MTDLQRDIDVVQSLVASVETTDPEWEAWQRIHAHLEQAPLAAWVPEGYALVPLVMTDAMRNELLAGRGSTLYNTHTTLTWKQSDLDSRYQAMLAAAQGVTNNGDTA